MGLLKAFADAEPEKKTATAEEVNTTTDDGETFKFQAEVGYVLIDLIVSVFYITL